MKKSVNSNHIILSKNNNKKNTFNVTDSINNLLIKTINKKKIVNKTKILINNNLKDAKKILNKSIKQKVIVNSKQSVNTRRVKSLGVNERRINVQKGGSNVITESVSLINTMKSLGNSIFKEISDITRIGYDINNVASSDSIPNNNIKTTTFQAPNLKNIPTR